ncbi:MAG: carbohydrate binding domain-containing protein [Blastocatellia bacterium]|nr:carbohydrate binding domain-containing protein [Blastocatellia bacterium]
MIESETQISTKTPAGKLVAAGVIVLALVFAWFAVRWQIGSLLVEITNVEQPNAAEFASSAMNLAPADPQPFWLAGVKEREGFSEENLVRSLGYLEKAVRLAPYDYRMWIELGRGLEQGELFDEAEPAFLRAVELAPNYAFPRWQYGNFLLRRGREDEAFGEFRKTTEKGIIYREQVFSLAWNYFDQDPAKVESLAADTPEVRVYLADFFAQRGAGADAVRVWNKLSAEEKAEQKELAALIARQLYTRRLYRDALEFARETGVDKEAEHEAVTNPGFETFIGQHDQALFGWQIFRNENRVDIGTDTSVKTEGNRSLKVNFRLFNKPEFYNIVQVVTVEPDTSYRLSFRVRTENLRSGSMPILDVLGGKDSSLLARSPAFATGTADWQEISVNFRMPPEGTSIELRVVREYCELECPITGIFWLDDFRLTRN